MRWSVLVVALLLAGCVQADPPEPPAWKDAVHVEGTATGGQDQQGPRLDGDVQARQENQRWRATQTTSITGDTGDYSRLQVDLDTFNGEITIRHGSGYSFRVDAFGRGDTEAEARASLAEINIRFSHAPAGDVLHIGVRAERGELRNNGAALTITLPAGPAANIRADTSNGHIELSEHNGPSAVLTTSNGHVAYAGDTDLLYIDTSNGHVEMVGNAIDMTIDTSNGAVTGNLRATHSGEHRVDTSNGEVFLRYAGDARYDALVETSNGGAGAQIPNGRPVGEQDKDRVHVRSSDYDTADVKVRLRVDTSNGGAFVQA